jgi:glutathione S-transferase
MAQWFFPAAGWRAEVTADVRVGGRYRVAMVDPEGRSHVQEGAYRAIEPDARLVFTWTCQELGVSDSVVTVELRDLGATTEVTISHQLPDDAAIVREHEEGWTGCLGSLVRYLETSPKEDPT